MLSFFALFKRSNPVLPVVAPPASAPRSSITRGTAAVWNALLSLLILLISFFGSFFSSLAGSLERLATTVDGFRVVLSSSPSGHPTEKATPEPFNPDSVYITVPPPSFNSANSHLYVDKESLGQSTPPRRLSRLPTYNPQPVADMDSSLQLAAAYQIINTMLKPEQAPKKFTFGMILVDKVPIGLGLIPPELGPVFKTTKHICDMIADQDKYAHLVYGEADPARCSMRSSVPRIDVSLPGPLRLDTSTNTSQMDFKPLDLTGLGLPMDQNTTVVDSEPLSNSFGPVDDTLDTTITTQVQDEDSSSNPVVLVLPPPGNDTSMETSSSNDSVLPTPIGPKFPTHITEPEVVTAPEVPPSPRSPPQDDTSNTLDRILQLPSSVSLFADSWNPPSPFVYTTQSPSQGTTRPIVSRKPVPQQSPAINSLHRMGSSVSLFADAWNPPSQYVYEHRTPPMNGTQPIVPRNKRRDFQVRPGDMIPIPSAPTKDTDSVIGDALPTTSTTRSIKRQAMVFEPEKPLDRLASTLRNSVSAPSFSGSPRVF